MTDERSLDDIRGTLLLSMELLHENLERLKADMNSPLAMKGGYNSKHGDAAYKLSKAADELSKEARQYAAKAAKAASNMSLEQKIVTMVDFISRLGKGDRLTVYTELKRREDDTVDGIDLMIGV